MKRILAVLVILTLLFTLNYTVFASETQIEEDEYKNIMIECVTTGDVERGRQAELLRNSKIDREGLEYQIIAFDDLNWLSKIMDIEAGNCSEEFYWGVGEVVLNRVASPEFPDTIIEVLEQEGPRQYYGKNSKRLAERIPQEHVVKAAWRLLEGERHLISSVVFQDNRIHGSGAYLSLYHEIYGWTYFSISSYPELYK